MSGPELIKFFNMFGIRDVYSFENGGLPNSVDFSSKGIEFYKGNPSSNFGKKIMHNKFCIIDFKKVIHGSNNWTNNAKYNNESIIIAESRELAEEFAEQFIKLKVNIKNPEKNSK